MTDEQEERFRDPSEDPRIQALMEREKRALGELADLNRYRREGEPVFELTETLTLLSRVDALASILVRLGIVDYVEFTGETMIRECEGVEQMVAAAREIKRQQSGLILPPHRNGDG